MNLNPQNKKYVSISQHWGSKRGKKHKDEYIYVNPITDEGKSKIKTLTDLEVLIEFHQWSEGNSYVFTDSPSPQWGHELYQIDGKELIYVSANYDTSD